MSSPGHNGSGLGQPMSHGHANGRSGPRSALVGDGSADDQSTGGPRRQLRDHPDYPQLARDYQRAHERYMSIAQSIAQRASSYIDAESCKTANPEEPALVDPRPRDQRERRRLHEPARVDASERPQHVNVANEPTRPSHAAPSETRSEPSAPVASPHRETHYVKSTCPCGIPNCSASAIRKKYFDQYPEGHEQAVRSALDFSFDRIGFTVMDGTSATWIGQPGDDPPPPLSDKPMSRRDAEIKSRLPEPIQPEPHATRKASSADYTDIEHCRSLRKLLAKHRPRRRHPRFARDPVEAKAESEASVEPKKSDSSKASGSPTESSGSFNGSYSSKRSNTLVAGAETDIDEDSSLGIDLLLKE